MAFCMNCGNQLPDGSRFCGNCGAQQGAPMATAPVQQGQQPVLGPNQIQKNGIIFTRADVIDYEIFGDDMQLVEIELDPGESVLAEAGAMNYMDSRIKMETIFGDGSGADANKGLGGKLLSAGKRALTGEGLFMTVFTNTDPMSKVKVAFASPYPGKIIPVDLDTFNQTLICQKSAFLCAAKGVNVGIHLQKKLGAGLGKALNDAIGQMNNNANQQAQQSVQQPTYQQPVQQQAPAQSQKQFNAQSMGAFGGLFGAIQNTVMGVANEAAKNMKICDACGQATTADKTFCPHCGAALPEKTAAESCVCEACGHQNDLGTKFCAGCGAKMPELGPNEEEAPICSGCGGELPEGMKFCPNCGTAVPQPNIICPGCGKEHEPDTRFCMECGTKLQ